MPAESFQGASNRNPLISVRSVLLQFMTCLKSREASQNIARSKTSIAAMSMPSDDKSPVIRSARLALTMYVIGFIVENHCSMGGMLAIG